MKRSITALFVFSLLISCAKDKTDYLVTIKTPYGDMVAILYDETPKHKANFIKLAKEHFFDSLMFHRVMQGFMIQGGDPDSKHAQPGQPLGRGGPGYTIDAEFVPSLFHKKGALSAARMGDNVNPAKASSGSQFYIVQGTVVPPEELDGLRYDQMQLMTGLRKMLEDPSNKALQDTLTQLYYSGNIAAYQKALFACAPQVEKVTGLKVIKDIPEERIKAYTTVGGSPHLDDQYTVFGQVIKGFEVIDKIASVQRDQADRPVEDVRMIVTVEEMPRKKITKAYGYEYPAPKK